MAGLGVERFMFHRRRLVTLALLGFGLPTVGDPDVAGQRRDETVESDGTDVWDTVTGWNTATPTPLDAPSETWRLTLPQRTEWDVAGDVIVVGDRDAGLLRRIDSANGEQAWSVAAPELDEVGLTADGSFALVQAGGAEGGQTFSVLDTTDGEPMWHDTSEFGDGEIAEVHHIGGTIVVVKLLFEHTVALDPETGAVRWELDTAAWMSGGVMLSNEDSVVGPLDPATGLRQWELTGVDDEDRIDVVGGVLVHAQPDGDLTSFTGYNLVDGAQLASISLPVHFYDLAAMGDGSMLVIEMGATSTMFAVDLVAGMTSWQRAFSGNCCVISARVDGAALVIADLDGYGVLDAVDGHLIAQTADLATWARFAGGGALVVHAVDDELIAFDVPELDERWRIEFEEAFLWPVTGGFVGLLDHDDADEMIGYIG